MKYSSRFFLYAPLALFLALAIGAGANWWIAATALSRKLDSLNGRQAMPGVTLRFSSKRIGGFPFNLDAVFSDFRIEVATDHGPSTWTSKDFALHALAYGREQMIFEAAGPQRLTWTDVRHGHHVLPFAVGEWHASSIVDEHGLQRFDMDLIGFGSPALTAARLQIHARMGPNGDVVDVAGEADSLRASAMTTSLFGDTINQARFVGTATQSKSFNKIRTADASWQDGLESWRNAGGALHIEALEIAFDRMNAIGRGVLSLAATHSVEGLVDFKVSGIEELIAAAARRHVEGGAGRGIAPALLERAAKSGTGESGLLGAVVTFHQGEVNVGDVAATTEETLY